MSKSTFRDIVVCEKLNFTFDDQGREKLRNIEYDVNFSVGDILQNRVLFNETVIREKFYKVTEMNPAWFSLKDREDNSFTKQTYRQLISGQLGGPGENKIYTTWRIYESE